MSVGTRAALGSPAVRAEAREKVTGTAHYATDHTPPRAAYAWPVGATVAKGEVSGIDVVGALATPGALSVLTCDNAPRLADVGDPALAVLQSPKVAYRGQFVALAVAETLQAARAMADAVEVEYDEQPHDVVLSAGHPGLYEPEQANGGHPGTRLRGDPDAAFAAAPVRVDATYTVPPLHNHPLEPHASVAVWHGDRLTVYDSSQGSGPVRETLAGLFRLAPEQVTVVSEHVGGGFGSKGTPRQQVVLAVMAARHTGRPVKLALPRRQLASITGHRAPTIQRLRLGAERFGWAGRDPAPGARREGNQLVGTGMAAAAYPVAFFMRTQRARARLYSDGTAVVSTAAQEFGTGMTTVLTQVAADGLGVDLRDVRLDFGDTDLPTAGSPVGSNGAMMVSAAVHNAATALRDKLIAMAVVDPDTREDYSLHPYVVAFRNRMTTIIEAPLPTMDDVARLTGDSDFSAFVARGVDAAVRRTALKKLFADPHFNTMDRLDVYIDDYTKPSPVSEAMLASLEHARNALRRVVDAVEEPPADADLPEDTDKTT